MKNGKNYALNLEVIVETKKLKKVMLFYLMVQMIYLQHWMICYQMLIISQVQDI